MTFHALPTFYPDIQDPNSNLADMLYVAADGSPIGRGQPWITPPGFEGIFAETNYWYGVAAGAAGALALRSLVVSYMESRENTRFLRANTRTSYRPSAAPRNRRNVRYGRTKAPRRNTRR